MSWGSRQALPQKWGLWGRVEVGKLCGMSGEEASRSRRNKEMVWGSSEEGRKMERDARAPGVRLGSGRPRLSLVPNQRVMAVRSCCSLSPTHTLCLWLAKAAFPGPHKISKVLSLATEISALFQQTHLLCRPAIKHGGAAGRRLSASRRNTRLPGTESKSTERSRKLLSPVPESGIHPGRPGRRGTELSRKQPPSRSPPSQPLKLPPLN